jgi:hypothetical protein
MPDGEVLFPTSFQRLFVDPALRARRTAPPTVALRLAVADCRGQRCIAYTGEALIVQRVIRDFAI